jgi:hypothetical protein
MPSCKKTRGNLGGNWQFLLAILIGFRGVSCRIQALGTVDRPTAKRYLSLCPVVRLALLGPGKQQVQGLWLLSGVSLFLFC